MIISAKAKATLVTWAYKKRCIYLIYIYFLCILFMWYFSLYICLFCYLSFPLCHHHRYLSISQSQPLRHNLFSPFTVHLSALFIDITFSLCCWRKLYSFLFSLLIHNSYVWSIKKLVIFCAESQVFLSLLNRIRLTILGYMFFVCLLSLMSVCLLFCSAFFCPYKENLDLWFVLMS